MRWALSLIVTIGLVGCGKETPQTQPDAKTEPKQEVKKPGPAKGESKAAAKKPDFPKAFTNTLGMKFVPVEAVMVHFCIWETRVKDYAAYAAANVGVDDRWRWGEPRFKQTATHPVVRLSWEDAQAFCAWLTKKELAEGKIKAGQKYRLLTDTEWSVAVGMGQEKGNTPEEKDGGIEGVYPWGKEWPPPAASGNYSKSLKVDKFDYTAPVRSFAANQHGLHDLGGNVWEWCEAKYSPNEPDRVLRGASWDYGDPDLLLSSVRGYNPPRRQSPQRLRFPVCVG